MDPVSPGVDPVLAWAVVEAPVAFVDAVASVPTPPIDNVISSGPVEEELEPVPVEDDTPVLWYIGEEDDDDDEDEDDDDEDGGCGRTLLPVCEAAAPLSVVDSGTSVACKMSRLRACLCDTLWKDVSMVRFLFCLTCVCIESGDSNATSNAMRANAARSARFHSSTTWL